MNNKAKLILIKAANRINALKTCINLGGDESAQNMWRGTVNGMLEAAGIITGCTYTWDGSGIYENGGNEPIVKA